MRNKLPAVAVGLRTLSFCLTASEFCCEVYQGAEKKKAADTSGFCLPLDSVRFKRRWPALHSHIPGGEPRPQTGW